MNKLRLHLEDLAVESFDTSRPAREKGTVFGEQCSCGGTCAGQATCDYTCDDATCPNTCDDATCAYTCDDLTCAGSCTKCYDTCGGATCGPYRTCYC